MIICSLLVNTIYSQVEDVCLFGRFNKTYWGEINGPFRYVAQEVNENHYYKQDNTGLDCSHDTYYMFFWNVNSQDEDGVLPNPAIGWYISWATGFTPYTGLVAHCKTVNAATPDQCDDGWEFLEIQGLEYVWVDDANVTVTAGRCPQLDCAALEVDDGTGTDDGCSTWTASSNLGSDEPLEQIGSNVFSVDKTGFGVRTLYFNYKLWRWICVEDTTQIELGCDIPDAYFNNYLVQLQPPNKRIPFTEIGPNSGSVDFLMEGDEGINTLTATCQGDGTTSTYAPTSENPTRNPSMTPQPTFKPVTYGPTTAVPTPSGPQTPQPTQPTTPRPTSPTEQQGAGGGDDDDGCTRWGKLCWWIWLIIIIAILCCCCLCCYLCFVLFKKRKENKAKNVEMFGSPDNNAGNTGSYQPDPTYTVD